MAISASGLYLANIIDMADSTQLALDFSLATHRLSLLAAAATPNFDTDVSWNTTNEVVGPGWLTPGVLLSVAAAGPASTVPLNTVSPTGTWMYDMTDVAVASTTISNASAVRLYADALAADNLILLINFTAPFSTFNGTFGIQFATTGVFALDLTP